MSNTQEQMPPCRKKYRTEANLPLDDPSELQPSKRLKPSIELHSAEFYNSLSKVWLTRRALKELDRRTNQINDLRHFDLTPQYITRNTSNKIRKFAKDGGPDLRDIRGYSAPTDIDIAHTMTSNLTPKLSSAYDYDFEQHLIDHRIYPNGYDYSDNRKAPKPDNLEEFYQRLAQPRPSLSLSRFTTADFEAFVQKNNRVIIEDDVMRNVVPIITGNSDIPNSQNLLFTRLDTIANNTIVNAKPDFYDGACLRNINKKVREDLGRYIIPTGHMIAPVAPNFFLEAKCSKGDVYVAKRQACYNGALGARGMHQLQSYKQDEPIYDSNAYTITSTYYDGVLTMYTTHPTQAEDGTTEYHMTQLRSLVLTDTSDSFRQGATALRNARDYAQEQRDAFISAANEKARSVNVDLLSPTPSQAIQKILRPRLTNRTSQSLSNVGVVGYQSSLLSKLHGIVKIASDASFYEIVGQQRATFGSDG